MYWENINLTFKPLKVPYYAKFYLYQCLEPSVNFPEVTKLHLLLLLLVSFVG